MKKRTRRSLPAAAGKKKTARAAAGYWHFDHIVQDATEEKMNRIWDGFIDAVEREGLVCAGSFHPAGGCPRCRGISDDWREGSADPSGRQKSSAVGMTVKPCRVTRTRRYTQSLPG